MFFRGRTLRQLDAKGRVMLTPEFREMLLQHSPELRLVLTTYDGCIVAFPFPEWEQFESKINGITNPSRNVRDFRRLVLGGAEVATLDSQGRIRLSREHLQYADITKEAMLVGQGSRFEIWSEERLTPLLLQNFDDVAEDMAASGINFGF